MKCTWSFFATSHGKSLCDGIGGTVKRLTSIASLRRTTNNHKLTVSAIFDFCKYEIIGISFYYISKESNMIIQVKWSKDTQLQKHYQALAVITISLL